MLVAQARAHGAFERFDAQLRHRPIEQHELSTTSIEFRRAQFVALDVRFPVTIDRTPGRRGACERDGVGRGSGNNRKHARFALKQPGETLIELLAPIIAAIGLRTALIGGVDRGHDLRRAGGGVVGAKVHPAFTPGVALQHLIHHFRAPSRNLCFGMTRRRCLANACFTAAR
jgi:hypothetical protein